MKQFDAVLLPEGERLTPAVGLDMKGKKLVVETVFGKRHTIAPDKLVFRRSFTAESKTEALETLRSDLAEGERLAREVDVELLWESVVDEPEKAWELTELATSWFAREPGLRELRAIDQSIGGEGAFFQRVAGRFRPVTRARRAATLERAVAEETARAAFEAMTERLSTYRTDGPPSGGWDTDPEAHEGLAQLAHFVQHGSGQGEAIVDALGLEGGRREAALTLLLEFGFVTRPTDLTVGRHKLSRTFKPKHLEALDAVRDAVEARAESLPAAQVDAFTIDDADTRDYDDALSVSEVDGQLRLGVHIADPSPYITRGTPLDVEAYGRGTTVYLPDQKYPMFPPELSDGLLSLTAGVLRPVLSFYFPLPFDGEPPEPHMVKERLSVRANLTYRAVDDVLAGDAEIARVALDTVRILADASESLRTWRKSAGAVTIHSPDVKITVDDDAEPIIERSHTDTPAHRIVSESMILVNFAGARYLSARGIAAIYRAQNPPREPVTSDGPYDPIVFRREVRKLEKARLSLEPSPHAGLGLALYTQLSSPLRRYGDLVMHRQLSHAIEDEPVPYEDRDALLEVVVTSDMNYQAAVGAERQAKHAWTLRYYESRLGEVVTGIVVDAPKGRAGVFAELDETGFVVRVTTAAGVKPDVGTAIHATVTAVDILEEEVVVTDQEFRAELPRHLPPQGANAQHSGGEDD